MSDITGTNRRGSPVLYGTASYFANNADFQPVLSNHFELYIKGLDNKSTSFTGSVYTGTTAYTKAVDSSGEVLGGDGGDLGEIFRLTVKEFKTADIKINSIELRHGNDRAKLAGQVSVGDCTITVVDVIGAVTQRALWGWFNLVYDPMKKMMGINQDYKKDGIIYQFAPDGTTVRAWECFGLWPSSIPSNSFSYDSSKEMDISFDLQCDNILMVRDKDLLSGGNDINVVNEDDYRQKASYPWEKASFGSNSES